MMRPLPGLWDEKNQKYKKFLNPNGGRSPIWISPETFDAAKDVSKPILVTEGPVKAMVLAQVGVCSIGLSGVWNMADKQLQDGIGQTCFAP
jgi:hypothetical protein